MTVQVGYDFVKTSKWRRSERNNAADKAGAGTALHKATRYEQMKIAED